MSTLVRPGGEVMLPDPGWPNFEMLALLHGATPVRYRLDPERMRLVPDLFVQLHNHADYSLLDGAMKTQAMVDRAVSSGQPALALTDHGVIDAIVRAIHPANDDIVVEIGQDPVNMNGSTNCLCGIFNNIQVVCIGNTQYLIHIGTLTK